MAVGRALRAAAGSPSRPPASAPSTSRCASDYAGVEHLVERDPITAAARLPGEDVHIVASYTQFSAIYRGSDDAGARFRGPGRARVPRAARHLRGSGQRRRARRAAALAQPRCRARRDAAGSPSPTRSTSTSSAGARTTRSSWRRPGCAPPEPRSSGHAHGGAVVLAVCAGFQLIGHSYEAADGEMLEGLGLVDAVTRAGSPRLIGEVIVEPDGAAADAHRLREPRRPHDPRPGRAPTGTGRRGRRQRATGSTASLGERLVGTYLHGPVLPRNPALADHLLSLGRRPARRPSSRRSRSSCGPSGWRRRRRPGAPRGGSDGDSHADDERARLRRDRPDLRRSAPPGPADRRADPRCARRRSRAS